jgi:hypothetical protein
MMMNNQFLIQAINLAMQLLSHRIFAFLSLLLTAGGFVWCLAVPDVLRIISASIFGLFCLMYQRKDAPQPVKENHNEE